MSNTPSNPCAEPPARPLRSRCVVMSVVVVSSLLVGLSASGQSRGPGGFPSTTQDRLNDQYWWPRKSTPPFSAFAGENACNECHAKQASSQVNTPMAEAAFRLRGRTQSQKLASGTLQSGTYLYRISSDHLGSRLAVSSGKQSITANITWIVGSGV